MEIAFSRPRFRTDLVAQPIVEAGQRFVDVTDPDSGTTFRFYEVEYSIACAMNGNRDLSGLAEWAEAELGIVPRPSPEELERVVSTLADLGYLSDAKSAAADLELGYAGVEEVSAAANPMPESADVELGLAGNEGFDVEGPSIPRVPDVGLGHAGNEGLKSARPDPDLAPDISILEDDEDNEPTKIKKRQPNSKLPALDALPPPSPIASTPEVMAGPGPLMSPGGSADLDDDETKPLPPPASDFEDEVSVDLSDHLHLGPDAVKEAVRQSKMIPAVEPPPSPPPVPDAEAAQPRPVQSMPTQPNPGQPPPTELPDKPVAVAKASLEPVAAKKPQRQPRAPAVAVPDRNSNVGLLVALFLLVLMGAAAAEYFLDIIGVRDMLELDQKAPSPAPPPVKEAVKQPAALEPPAATLTMVEVPPQEVTAPREGTLATIAEAGEQVDSDAIVARLKGYEKIEKKIRIAEERQDFYQKKLDKAEAAKNQREIAKNRTKLEAKKRLIADSEEELDSYLIKAPIAGTVVTELEANAFVEAEQTILSIQVPSTLQATFNVPQGESYIEGSDVELTSAQDSQKRLACEIIKVEGQSVTVECPSDGDVQADDRVVLPLPDQ
ncbi:MAG: hypothetical protein MJE77_33605 [Proteobacteria bacterium]|nr:hypothetical protein [Pseudomonadota bacterium]